MLICLDLISQVVGVFPGPKFDDAEGADQGEADVELLGWEERAVKLKHAKKTWRNHDVDC